MKQEPLWNECIELLRIWNLVRSNHHSRKIRCRFRKFLAIIHNSSKAISIGSQLQTTFAKAYKAGVKIAFGTDAVLRMVKLMEFVYMNEGECPHWKQLNVPL